MMSVKAHSLPAPFAYATQPHRRRHGPQGFGDHRQYRQWLRDEFEFRCVYCLRRETWQRNNADWEIDHFLPQSTHPGAALDYDNLVYACNRCNRTKAAQFIIPSPEHVAYGDCIEVEASGQVRALKEEGVTLIEALDLNDDDYVAMRRNILVTCAEVKPSQKGILRWLLGYPENLPDLAREPKPRRNIRPAGIAESHFERKRHGSLPNYY